MDLVNERFVTDDEMVGLWNDTIQGEASEIYKLGVEDEYFTKRGFLTSVAGQSRCSLPSDIYACKIRDIIFDNGSEIYPVTRLRRRHKALKMAEIDSLALDLMYQYDIENPDVNTGFQLVFTPPFRESASNILLIKYIREVLYIPLVSAGSLAASRAAKIDIPEFMGFTFADVKAKIAAKIPHPNLAHFEAKREEQRKLMIDALTEQVVDDATEFEPDMSFYWRHT